MELDDQIVNRTIAEFMGEYWDKEEGQSYIWIEYKGEKVKAYSSSYTESLDALVPVWEKLQKPFELSIYKEENLFLVQMYNESEEMESIQQAAAYATYRAIKELRNE
jgi:hypothetical protein